MDNFLSFIKTEDLNSVITSSFEINVVPIERQKNVFLMASHCCLNGPVGTNKVTSFPQLTGVYSISSYVGTRVSNNSWRGFCVRIAELLKKHYPEVCAKCQQVKLKQDLWPLNEAESSKK
jgi:hypothetical protein